MSFGNKDIILCHLNIRWYNVCISYINGGNNMPRPKGSKNKPKMNPAADRKEPFSTEGIDQKIADTEAEIKELSRTLKEKKVQLKALQKSRAAAEKLAAKKKAEEEKAAILAAVEASEKSIDEILNFLR